MNNSLVQRLRDTGPGGGIGAGLPLCREAADRIEALEAALRQIDALCHQWPTFPLGDDIRRAAREALDA